MFASLYVIFIILLTTIVESLTHRRTLHQPFFPVYSAPPLITQPPIIPPQPAPSKYHYHNPKPKESGPKYPFSSQSPPPAQPNDLFFPSYSSPPSPPSPSSSASSSPKTLGTFPANITSIDDLPQSSPSNHVSHKLAAITITVSLLSATLIVLIAGSLLYYHHRHHKHILPKPLRSDSVRLVDTGNSDKPSPPQSPPHRPRDSATNSAEFLYLGTLADSPRIADHYNSLSNVAGSSSVLGYQKMGSPELHPLPPLPRNNFRRSSRAGFLEEGNDDAEFFSRKASSDVKLSPNGNKLNSASPTSSSSSKSNSPEVDFPQPPRPVVKSPSPSSSPSSSSWDTHNSPARASTFTNQQHYEPEKLPPPQPLPMPPVVYWETAILPSPAPSEDPLNSSASISESYPKDYYDLQPRSRNASMSTSTTSIHVTALDGLVNVNSLFTIAVFVGLTLTTPGQRSLENRTDCDADISVAQKLLVFEVVSFSFFLFSSLVAQGLKLAINLLNSKDADEAFRAHINLKVLRFGMLGSAVGSVMGCLFLMLSMVNVIEIRLGTLSCGSKSTVHSVAAMVVLVSTALLVYISTAVYAFLH